MTTTFGVTEPIDYHLQKSAEDPRPSGGSNILSRHGNRSSDDTPVLGHYTMNQIIKLLIRPALSGALILGYITTAESQGGNSVDIGAVRGVSAPLANTIIAGQPFVFEVNFHYTLNSVGNALLQIGAEEYPQSAGGCKGAVHQTNGGRQVSLRRGSEPGSMTIIWNGNRPVYPGGGYITFTAVYANNANNMVFQTFAFPQFCYRFVRPSGQRID